jgi:hypothetical protein
MARGLDRTWDQLEREGEALGLTERRFAMACKGVLLLITVARLRSR